MKDIQKKNLSIFPMKRLEYFSNFRLSRFKTNKQKQKGFSYPTTNKEPSFVKAYAVIVYKALKSMAKTLQSYSETKANN